MTRTGADMQPSHSVGVSVPSKYFQIKSINVLLLQSIQGTDTLTHKSHAAYLRQLEKSCNTMKLIISIFFSIFCNLIFAQISLDGIYEGVQPKYWTLKSGKQIHWKDTERKNHFWYSSIYLKIRGDSVFWDDSPISMYKKDTIYSASDGGFHYYKGTHTLTDSLISINLKQLYCDYCGIPFKKDSAGKWTIYIEERSYIGKINLNGFVINGYQFRKLNKDWCLMSEGNVPDFWKNSKYTPQPTLKIHKKRKRK